MKSGYIKLVGVIVFQVAILMGVGKGFCETGLKVVPQPLEAKVQEGSFKLTPATGIEADKDLAELAKYSREILGKITGYDFPVKPIKGEEKRISNVVRLQLAELPDDLGEEGYRLTVTKNGVLIRAKSAAGAFYGVQTLRQLLPAGKGAKAAAQWEIPCVEIKDQPRFGWRGLMIDSSRTFQTMEYLKKTIDLMAMFKMNVLHFHLVDDQGWRLEIKKYPKLTQEGARFPAKWNEPKRYEGYYTQDDIRELVSYAKTRNITVVPEIELPGHSLAALSCYPELSCTGGPFEIHPFTKGPGIHKDIFCAGNEKSFEFFENVFKEVIELFPSEYVHIGGDEAPKNRWKKCPKCQQRIKDEGLKNEHELQSYFVNRAGKLLEKHGRKFMGWNEILGAGLSPNAAIMSWQGMRGGFSAAKSGRKAVMSPTSHCYFDYGYRSTNTQRAYSFEPVPDNFKPEYAKNILGIQANFWSHLAREPHLVDEKLWPRLISIAERGWSERSVRDWHDFSRRLGSQLDRLHIAGVKFYPPNLVGLEKDRVFIGKTEVEMINASEVMKIHYTLDGSKPTTSSPLYTKPITLTETTTIKAKGFLPDGRETQLLEGSYKKQTYREPVVGKQTKPGLQCEYRLGIVKAFDENYFKLPLKKTSVESTIGIPSYTVKSRGKEGAFTLTYKGYIKVPHDGIYTFYLKSDDGSHLLIEDDLVVDNFGGRSKELSGQIALKAGMHPITILYFEYAGGESLKASYSGANIEKKELTADQLFH